jgi:D-serine deaminase-like pyridoxal phosphate-dependent protein
MAGEQPWHEITRVAGEDLSNQVNQYRFVKLDTDGTVILPTGVTDRPLGVLQNDPKDGGNATVQISGLTFCRAGAAVAIGDVIGTSADGEAEPKVIGTNTTHYVAGVALTAAANAGEYFQLLLGHPPNRAT